jgi:membrane protease YdiL (CAAX protease family)
MTNRLPEGRQYTFVQIAGLWAIAALPMALLAWVVTPALVPHVKLPPALLFWLMMIAGMAWQFTVSLWVIHHEEGNLRWSTVRRRTWLNAPRDPRTGNPRARLFGWLLPCLFIAFVSLGLGTLLPPFAPYSLRLLKLSNDYVSFTRWPAYANVTELASPEFAGQWWLVVVVLISWALSAFFAEEFLFRGILLPKMAGVFGKWDWAANAAFFGLYHLYKPWMIPFRLIEGLVIAWPARRFHSNWMAVAMRTAEGVGLLAVVWLGVMTPPLAALPASLTFPYIDRRPPPSNWYRGVLSSLPTYDPNSDAIGQVDLRGYDLSALDLRGSFDNLLYATFDGRTVWPPGERMPQGFVPARILELSKNPGLGVRSLHSQDLTGRGVGIAIIDQTLLTEHQEYTDQLRWYEEIDSGDPAQALMGLVPAQMHGPAVASLAVGKTVGVAPEADLYYIGARGGLRSPFMNLHDYARAVRRILQINEQLPASQKIRVISISWGWLPNVPGYDDFKAAVQEAKAAEVFVVSVNIEEIYGFKFQGLGRSPTVDPDAVESFEPALFWAKDLYTGHYLADRLLVPMESRTVADPSGSDVYTFDREGGWSWAIPYIAGVYALAAQVDPTITPDRFWSLALETGRTIEIKHEGQIFTLGPIIDPVALINALRAAPQRFAVNGWNRLNG